MNYEFAIGLKICAITAGIKKKNKKKHDEIVLLAKSKLNSIEILISRALVDSVETNTWWICFINNALKEYNDMKEEITNLKT